MNQRLSAICTLILFVICLILALPPAKRDRDTDRRADAGSRVHLIHADRLYFDDRVSLTAQFLVGNVQFSHEGTLM